MQAAHAAITFCNENDVPSGCTIVLATVPDEEALTDLLFRAGFAGIANEGFWEPDLGDRLTAVALAGDGADRICRRFPLAFPLRGGENNEHSWQC